MPPTVIDATEEALWLLQGPDPLSILLTIGDPQDTIAAIVLDAVQAASLGTQLCATAAKLLRTHPINRG